MTNDRQTSSSTVAVVVLVIVVLLALVSVVVCGFAGVLFFRIGHVHQPPQVVPVQQVPAQPPPVLAPRDVPAPQQSDELKPDGSEGR